MKIASAKKGRIIKETITGYLCIAPMLVALFVFTFYPIFQSFFDVLYPDTEARAKVLNLFPADFKKGYKAYKDNKLSCRKV